MSIDSIIAQAVSKAVKELYGVESAPETIVPQATRKEFEGNLTVVVFPWVKAARKAPDAVAAEIGEWLVANEPAVEKFNAVKGFLNLTISPKFWNGVLSHIAETPDYGITAATETSPLVMVEYSSPNTNKPLHLGHVRNNLLGFSLSEILKAMLAWQKWGEGITPESCGKKGDHLIGDFYVLFDKHFKAEVKELVEKGMSEDEAKNASPLMKEAREMLVKWEQKDPEIRALWQRMNQWVYDGFDVTYKRMGVNFDKIYYESDTYLEGKDKVLEGLAAGKMYRKEDGSVWADLTGEGLDHKLLLRSDGTSVYMTQDIGTAKLRFQDYPIDKMIYVVGNEQNYHFQVLSILLDRLGFKWGKDLVHFSYGMVELPEGKMKSREGTVVDADDLMDDMVSTAKSVSAELGKLDGLSDKETAAISEMVGLGALKYFLLKVDPRKNITFNPKESIDFNGNTGPFIQYTYARIRSVLRKAEEEKLEVKSYSDVTPGEREIALIQALSDFPSVVQNAGQTYSPALIANYVYDLVKIYNQFYHDCSILKEEDAAVRSMRLELSRQTSRVIKTGMGLLGIDVPERM